MKKTEYALEAIKLAEENHISINGFSKRDDEFYMRLGKIVYDTIRNRRKLKSYSFSDNPDSEGRDFPGKTTFISFNES